MSDELTKNETADTTTDKKDGGESTAEKNARRFAVLAESSREFIGMSDANLVPFYVNRAGLEMVGLDSLNQARLPSALDFFFPEDRAMMVDEFFPRVRRDGSAEVEIRIHHFKTGEPIWVVCSVVALRNEQGEIDGFGTVTRDISQSKRLEEQLSNRLTELETVYRTAPVGLSLVDTDFRFIRVNERLAEMNGIPVSEHIGRTVREIVPGIIDEVERIFRRVTETGEPIVGLELEGETDADPGVRHVWSENWFPIKDANGKTVAVNVSVQDVTEFKRTAEALRESETRMRMTIEAAGMGTWALDINTHRVRWNDQHYRIFGLEPGSGEEDIGRFFEFVHPDDREMVRERMESSIDERTPYECEFRIVRTDGEVCWMTGYGRVTEEEDGKATVMNGVLYDVTARKHAELALRASDERMRLLMESFTDVALFTTDTNSIVTNWNPGAEKIFGYTAEEMVGKQAADIIFTPEDREKGEAEKERRTAAAEGKALDERWHMRKNGERFFASGFMVPLTDGEKLIGYGKIASDLTERKRYEDELKQAREQLEKRVEERTYELAETNASLRQQIMDRRRVEEERVSLLRKIVTTQEDERRRIARDLHDHMGQRLTALRLKLASLKDKCGDDEVCKEIERLQELGAEVDSDISFLAWELRPSVLDDLGLVTAVENFVGEWSDHFGIKAEFHANGLRSRRLASEIETNLYRIAQEALNNVYKHSRATAANVLLEMRRMDVVLIVEDNGVGFDVEQQRLDRRHGSAMGLLGIQERAAIVGGTVEIESGPDKGTTLFARIPAVFVDEKRQEDEERQTD